MPARVFLRPDKLRDQSAYHTAYTGDGAIRPRDGETPKIYKLSFFKGTAHGVEDGLYRRMKDAGIATTDKP